MHWLLLATVIAGFAVLVSSLSGISQQVTSQLSAHLQSVRDAVHEAQGQREFNARQLKNLDDGLASIERRIDRLAERIHVATGQDWDRWFSRREHDHYGQPMPDNLDAWAIAKRVDGIHHRLYMLSGESDNVPR